MNEPIIPGPATALERGAGAMETTPEQWKAGVDRSRLETLVDQDGTLEDVDGRKVITAHNSMCKTRIASRAETLGESIKWSGLTGVLR